MDFPNHIWRLKRREDLVRICDFGWCAAIVEYELDAAGRPLSGSIGKNEMWGTQKLNAPEIGNPQVPY